MKKSAEQSKRRLRNYAERNDCQFSGNGDNWSMTQKGGREKGDGGGGGEERRNPDGPTSGLAILTCKGRLFEHIFPRTVLVFFLLFLLFFFSFLNNSYIGRFSVRKREQRALAICQIQNVNFLFLLRLKYLSF